MLPTAPFSVRMTHNQAAKRFRAAVQHAFLTALFLASPPAAATAAETPDILLVTVDTLRADRLSGYGYSRPTSPNLDRLMATGARFTEARTVEPLTNPALTSLVTSLYPHEHGATRNGLRMRPELQSLPKVLDERGYRTAAFVSNWTLKDSISGLSEHFERYEEVLTKKRWFGFFKGEATAEDVNEAALTWLSETAGRRRPVFAWVHYTEPHAPYLHQRDQGKRLGIDGSTKENRYDSEIGFVDEKIGDLLEALPRSRRGTLVVFTSDHGESLGEHDYWGHGRNLYEPGLHVPLSISWPGVIDPAKITAPALLTDIAPTVLGLLGLDIPQSFRGYDWSAVLRHGQAPPEQRTSLFQAHKGAVLSNQEAGNARRAGLLEVGILRDGNKEVLRLTNDRHRLFDLAEDPGERSNLSEEGIDESEALRQWRDLVISGLERTEGLPPADVDPESVEKLKALGYIN
ncbi:MAG: sulfatase [Acidobacteriota bacterium]